MPAPSSGWVVTSQGAPTTQVTQAGTVQQGITVYFRLGSGTESSVFVPDSAYNPDAVRQIIAGKAAALEAVSNLSSPAAPGM